MNAMPVGLRILALGLFLSLKSKILHLQNVSIFQFYIRLPNFRLLGSIMKKKSRKVGRHLELTLFVSLVCYLITEVILRDKV